MNSESLRELQAPFKERYKHSPEAALITLRAQGNIDDSGVACTVESGDALIEAGLHPSAGGSGLQACSGDMLLQALCACA
ncbi:MAG TPA: OsmC family peroxiredoxin, partial [Alphaproteobacteria bacterium]|nr:OsmC family peroxiredoxin [Alphaproteobacteria bacterium]